MSEKIPEWLEGKQLSSEALKDFSKIHSPVAMLYQLLDDEVPDYLYPLVMAARMIDNFVIYDDPALDKMRALEIIERVREELEFAERRCRED